MERDWRRHSLQEIRTGLGRVIFREYPLITRENFEDFIYQEIPFCSFRTTGGEVSYWKILPAVLLRARNPGDPAFCRHGFDKHPHFQTAIDAVIRAVGEGTARFYTALERVEIDRRLVPEVRFLIDSPEFDYQGEKVRGRAVLLRLASLAYKVLERNGIHNPNTYKFINGRYGSIATSRVLTAFLFKVDSEDN